MKRTHGTRRRIGAMVALVALAASCGGDDGSTADTDTTTLSPTDSADVAVDATVDSAPLFVRTTDGRDATASTDATDSTEDGDDAPVVAAPGSTTTSTTSTIPLVSDTGVPGIDSDDVFCRSWSEFAGSFRAIGLVSAIRDVDAGLRLEVIASGAVVAAIDAMGDALPAELEPERDTLLSDYAGPFGRRAAKAGEALTAAGLDGDGIDVLAELWLVTLADVGIDDPSLDVEIPDEIDVTMVDAAAADFAASTPAIGDDPSLNTFTEIPLTDAYTFANCPDGGTLAGNDDL